MVHIKKTLVSLMIVLAFVIISVYGCHPLQSSLPGTYVSNEKNVVDSIFIHKDFYYTHKALVRDSLKVQSGRWDYFYGTIRLYNFQSNTQVSPVDSGTRITEVNISVRGKIQIEINDDSDNYYLKIK